MTVRVDSLRLIDVATNMLSEIARSHSVPNTSVMYLDCRYTARMRRKKRNLEEAVHTTLKVSPAICNDEQLVFGATENVLSS